MADRVVLVDDELHILRAAEIKLKRFGFLVDCASDGEEAWERIQQQRPQIVVSDLQMPRLDGIGLIERIRAEPDISDLPVILLTAKGYEMSQQQVREKYGVFEVLAKPFSPRNLCNRVQMALEDHRQRLECSATPASDPS